jgi:hypothetical protein
MKPLILITILCYALTVSGQNYCMRFFGHGTGDIDRVKISIDAPEKPVDVAFDFTIEFEMKAILADNPMGGNATAGYNDDWTLGHIMVDRDIFGAGDYGDFGVSLVSGRVAFGANNGSQAYTLIGTTMVADNNWHHIALVRGSAGFMYIFVDGLLDGYTNDAPDGNLSYRNNRSTSFPNDPYIVLGAEKHDYDNTIYPSYNGLMDEMRISDIQRYNAPFTAPSAPFAPDGATMGLYHFNEGSGDVLQDAATVAGAPSQGSVQYGGIAPAGPVWVLRSSPPSGIWTGNVNSDWFTPGNWNDGQIPLATTQVTLPAGSPNYPVITGTASVCYDLVVEAGANIIIVSGAHMLINGSLVLHGTIEDLSIKSDRGIQTIVAEE